MQRASLFSSHSASFLGLPGQTTSQAHHPGRAFPPGAWPDRRAAAGSGTGESLRQPVLIINRPGAGGAVGMASVARARGTATRC